MVKRDLRYDWIRLLEEVEFSREDLAGAIDAGDQDRRREAARKYWNALSLLLDRYQHAENWRDGTPKDEASVAALPSFAIPPIVARNISRLFWTLSTGDIPETVLDVVGPGRVETGPYETMGHIAAAIYVHAAKRGVVNDPAPVKRVAAAFGVSRETVRQWCQAHPDVDRNPLLNPDLVTQQMVEAGERYQKVGRGEAAIRKRARKRQ